MYNFFVFMGILAMVGGVGAVVFIIIELWKGW